MKKTLFLLIISLLVLPTLFALDLDIQKQSTNEVMILDLQEPAIFNLTVKNNGPEDNLIFYTFFTQSMYPKGTTPIKNLETINVKVEVYPPQNQKTVGHTAFDIFIKGNEEPDVKKTLVVNVINLENAFDIETSQLDSGSETITVYIQNIVNFDFKEIEAEFSSAFFDFKEKFSLEPYETKEFTVELKKKDFEKLTAGLYALQTKVKVEDIEAEFDSTINFAEKNMLKTTKESYGFIINTEIITRTNEGNVIEKTDSVIEKNIISRLFTTITPEPTFVERQGSKIYYSWNKEIEPGESFEIKVRTNWLFPLLIILLIVIVVVITKLYLRTNLILRKRVSFVRAKGGEFALKVSIIASAKRYIEKVSVIDRLPALVKVHERFGSEKPIRVDEKNKKIEWQFEKLEAGESRILTYIIFSRIGLLGKFALPRTSAIFEREGEVKETQSNKTFFMAEPKPKKKDNYSDVNVE